MRLKSLVVAMAAVASLAPIASQAQSTDNSNPWMVRVRATDLIWQNGQTNAVSTLNVKAENKVIPEFDVSYFFTKNIATELVLTYPQSIQINAGSWQLEQKIDSSREFGVTRARKKVLGTESCALPTLLFSRENFCFVGVQESPQPTQI